MGAKNVTGVRKVMRGGKPRWFIDFRYNDTGGVRRRFRRDASVQNHAASLQEARRLMVRAAETGSPESEAEEETTEKDIVTFGSFVDGTFTDVFMPKYRPS